MAAATSGCDPPCNSLTEDGAAAAMLTEPLSGRRDLVEGLDADAILDYLAQHGVLDAHSLHVLRGLSPMAQRNRAVLQQVEREGPNAVALFINALRQSGQLHLASSLDNTPRIKPVSGTGYWEKQRHKGQVTITMELRALRLVVPERDSDGDVVDVSMLRSPHKTRDLDPMASRRVNQSYENMVVLESPDGGSRSIRIVDYPYGEEDEDDTQSRKRSFFCLCFPRVTKKKKAKEKYMERQQQQKHNPKTSSKGAEDVSRELNGSGVNNGDRVCSPEGGRHGVPLQGGVGVGDSGSVPFAGDSRRNSGSPRKDVDTDRVDHRNLVNERKSHGGSGRQGKENADPIIMEYNKNMELVRLKAQKQRHRGQGKAESSAVVMCEKWKSGGHAFRRKREAFLQQFDFDLQTYVIKYFEQDRGTLVLQVWTDGKAMYVSNICLTVEQVRQLRNDYIAGSLRERLDLLLRSNGSLEKLDIKDVDLAVAIQEDQFERALSDLS